MTNDDVSRRRVRLRQRLGAPVGTDSLDEQMDELNVRLMDAERALVEIPGKVGIDIEGDDGFKVALARVGEEWRLGVIAEPALGQFHFSPWDECSLMTKTMLARFLPDLLRAMHEAVDSRRQKVREAHAALDQFENLLHARRGGA